MNRDWLEVLVSVIGFPSKLDACDSIDEHSGDHKNLAKHGGERVAVAGGAVIGTVVWLVVLKDGAV